MSDLRSSGSRVETLQIDHRPVIDQIRKGTTPVKFKILQSTNSQWFFRIVASNNTTLAHSETYWNRSDAISAAQLIINQAGNGTIEQG